MKNHARFQENISIYSAIQIVKRLIRMTVNSSRKHVKCFSKCTESSSNI